MCVDSSHLISDADNELLNPETTAERVQELFKEWWDKRTDGASLQEDVYVLPVMVVDTDNVTGETIPQNGVLHFPKAKLSDSQIELLEQNMKSPDPDKAADAFILWAAGRAVAIAVVPIPLADVGPLMVNEAYMIYRIANAYGFSIDKSVVAMLSGVAGGSIAGKVGASFLPFLKVPMA